MVLVVCLTNRPKNNLRIRYCLSKGTYLNSYNDHNGYDWLVLARLYLYDNTFVSKEKYYDLLLQKEKENKLIDRRRAKKIQNRNKIIHFLEVLKNGL